MWKQLAAAPISARMGECITINKDEFILITTPYQFAGDDEEAWSKIWHGIFKYNAKSNNWGQWIEYDKPPGTPAGITYNEMDGKLYWIGYKGQIYIFDIINQKSKKIQGLLNKATKYKNVMVIDKTLHLTKSDVRKSSHFVCNVYDSDKNIKITPADDTDIDYLATRNKYGYRNSKNVYLKSKNIIVAIGCVPYTFDRKWRESQENKIMIYSVEKNEWKILENLKMNQRKMEVPTILVTDDEKYVIIIGEFECTEERWYGYEDDDDVWNESGEEIPVYVLEIGHDVECKLKQCMIRLPMRRFFSIAITAGIKDEDVMLVAGYLRLIHHSYSSPMDVMNEILKWMTDDIIHWIEYGTGGKTERRHFAISLSQILSYCDISDKP